MTLAAIKSREIKISTPVLEANCGWTARCPPPTCSRFHGSSKLNSHRRSSNSHLCHSSQLSRKILVRASTVASIGPLTSCLCSWISSSMGWQKSNRCWLCHRKMTKMPRVARLSMRCPDCLSNRGNQASMQTFLETWTRRKFLALQPSRNSNCQQRGLPMKLMEKSPKQRPGEDPGLSPKQSSISSSTPQTQPSILFHKLCFLPCQERVYRRTSPKKT